MQLSVAHPVLTEVPALLLVDAPVLLNGLDPLVQLVRQSCVNTFNPTFTSSIVLVESAVGFRTL